MDEFNKENEVTETEQNAEQIPVSAEAPAADAEFEPVEETGAPEDAEFVPVTEEETKPQMLAEATLYEPAVYEKAKKEKRRKPKKEKGKRENDGKRPLTWGRVTWVIIVAAVAAFVSGIVFTFSVLAPLVNNLEVIIGDKIDGIEEVIPEIPEKFTENKGEKKEREEYSDHPEELPEMGGKAPVITDAYNPVPEIVENLSDGVVMVTTGVTTRYGDGSEDQVDVSVGTGFVVSAEGYIVTNNHVITKGTDYRVTFPDGTEYDGKLVGTDTECDVAVLKIDAKEELTVLPIGDSDQVRTGEMSIAIGSASGVGETLAGTVTVGYISAVNRELMFNGNRQPFIQTDTAVNSGNSGGPLVNSKGEVIGVVTLKSLISSITESGEAVNSEGLGFAIPINRVMEKAEQIILGGDIKKAGIGLTYVAIDAEEAEESGLPEGLMVYGFMENGPSKKCGLQIEDVITEVDGKTIAEIGDIAQYITDKGIGSSIEVTVDRNGETFKYEIDIVDINAIRVPE